MPAKKIFFLAGTHSSGKTTLRGRLECGPLHLETVPEVAEDIAAKGIAVGSRGGRDSDDQINRAESARMDSLAQRNSRIIVVETGMPGNLAYALVRNSEAVSGIVSAFQELKGSRRLRRLKANHILPTRNQIALIARVCLST